MKDMNAGMGDPISWARRPPERGLRAPWESAICDCFEMGDTRFIPILQTHVERGVCKSERALKLVQRLAQPETTDAAA